MQPLSSFEQRYLDRFPDIDPGDVGAKRGMGAQHVVRGYGQDRVIKYPRLETMRDLLSQSVGRILTPSTDKLRSDLDTAQEYFGDHVLPTDIALDARHTSYCILQPDLGDYETVTPALLDEHPAVREEFSGIVEADTRLLLEKGVFLDQMGWNPGRMLMLQAYLDNVVMTTSARFKRVLQLPDVTLFPEPDWSVKGLYFGVLQRIQRMNLSRFRLKP